MSGAAGGGVGPGDFLKVGILTLCFKVRETESWDSTQSLGLNLWFSPDPGLCPVLLWALREQKADGGT